MSYIPQVERLLELLTRFVVAHEKLAAQAEIVTQTIDRISTHTRKLANKHGSEVGR